MDGVRVEILAPDRMERHVEAWRDLVARCLEPSVFNEPGFLLTAARFIPCRPEPRFLLVWYEGSGPSHLIGLCCLSGWSGVPLAAWLHVQATSAFPILDREQAGRALDAMLSFIARRAVMPALLIQGLQEDGPTARLLIGPARWRCREMERRSRAILRHAGPVPPLLVRGDKELRRQARRLADRGVVAIVSARSPEAIGSAVDRFLDLERQGWKGRRGTALSQSRALADFTGTMTRALAQTDQCRVDTLTLDGTAAAVGIVLRSGQRSFYWKTAYDETIRRLSPGVHLALAITATQLAETVSTLTDSCAVPNHAMIDRLWPDRMVVVDLLCGLSTRAGWRFDLAAGFVKARRWVRHQVKHSPVALRRLTRRRDRNMP